MSLHDLILLQNKCEELERQLEQQRFNNKHNLSIDQKVADRMATLEQELLTAQKRIEELERNLDVCKNDYWFMINLIERYGSNKDQTLNDCLERMKFRKPLFKCLINELKEKK